MEKCKYIDERAEKAINETMKKATYKHIHENVYDILVKNLNNANKKLSRKKKKISVTYISGDGFYVLLNDRTFHSHIEDVWDVNDTVIRLVGKIVLDYY